MLADLLNKIDSRSHTVGIIGLGYVGVPLMIAATRAGFPVIGFDISEERRRKLMSGESGIKHIPPETIHEAIEKNLFDVADDFARLNECDSILIAVPTPLTKQREPDLSFVENTTQVIAASLRKNQLIVLESTTWPGTTLEIMKPILERTGLKSGEDFFLAYSPEREDPGNVAYKTVDIPKVVGGDGPDATALAERLYSDIVGRVVPVTGTSVAEAVKLTENIFRAVNIAMVNELKVIFDRMGIDVWEVIDAAATKPFGFMPFYPGPGLGGHCIPIDPFYLTWKAREFNTATRFIELAGQINTNMPTFVVAKLAEALDHQSSRGLNKAKILMIGVAYKRDVDDMRESPSLALIELIENRGSQVDYHDPFIPVIPSTREHAPLAGRRSVPLTAENIASYDAVVIVTDHTGLDWEMIGSNAKLVIDTRNAMARAGVSADTIVKA